MFSFHSEMKMRENERIVPQQMQMLVEVNLSELKSVNSNKAQKMDFGHR